MLHTKTKRLEMCIDINTEISEVDYYTWIFTSRIFRLVTCNCNRLVILLISIFSCKWLTSSSHKVENFKSGGGGARFPNKSEGGGEILGNFFKKNKLGEGRLLWTQGIHTLYNLYLHL